MRVEQLQILRLVVMQEWVEVMVYNGLGGDMSLMLEYSSRRIAREDRTEEKMVVVGPSVVTGESDAHGVVVTSLW